MELKKQRSAFKILLTSNMYVGLVKKVNHDWVFFDIFSNN